MLKFRSALRFYSTTGREAFTGFMNQGEVPKKPEEPVVKKTYNSNEELREHPKIKPLLEPAPVPPAQYLSPFKRQLYEQVLSTNNGKFTNNQLVELNGKKYKLHLSKEEQKALEPSVYIQSYRIKSSWKKTYMFLRIFRQMPLLEAITQCHFSPKSLGRDVGEMLERGRADAVKLGMDPSELYISQIWVGKDGEDDKRVQAKGRGRAGVVTHPYVHVKAIIKNQSVKEAAAQRFKERLDRKLYTPLRNWKIKEDFTQTADYKW